MGNQIERTPLPEINVSRDTLMTLHTFDTLPNSSARLSKLALCLMIGLLV